MHRELGVVMLSVSYVCVSQCLCGSLFRLMSFQSLDLETSFLVHRYISRKYPAF